MTYKYSDLGLKRQIIKKSFQWGDKQISYLDYLPIEAKYDVVMITLQKSLEDGIYNPIKMDMYFHLNLVYMYCDIEFGAEDREDEGKLYDELKSSGFLAVFLRNINADEYQEMQEIIDEIADLHMTYKNSAASIFHDFVEDLPTNAEAARQIVDSFDPEKYQNVLDFAKAANGGRPVPAE